MREGFYRLQYEIERKTSAGVLTMHAGVLSGCDRNFFLHGIYEKKDSKISGKIVFERHTPNPNSAEPNLFSVRFSGVVGSNYGQFEFSCPDFPAFKGHGKFSWLTAYQK